MTADTPRLQSNETIQTKINATINQLAERISRGNLTDLNIVGATALTAPAVNDILPIYDLSATTNKGIALSDLWKVIAILTALTAPGGTSDGVAVWDNTNSVTKFITLPNLLKIINNLTDDPALDSAADFGSHYDASAGDVKKHLIGRRIIQVVSVASNTQTTVVGTGFVATAIVASITPKNANNKVLVLVSGTAVSGTVNAQAIALLQRSPGTINISSILAGSTGGTAISSGAINYLDSPATTSATTYTVYCASDTAGATAIFPYATNLSFGSIVLIELAP